MDEIIEGILDDLLNNKIGRDEAKNKIMGLDIEPQKKLTECYNCNEHVVMVSSGEFCPSCYC